MDETDAIIDSVLLTEGGYVNHPADRGGATNWGVTLDALRLEGQFRDVDLDDDGDVDADDVRLLPRTEAAAILRQRYADGPGFSKIGDPQVRLLCVDASVNHGPRPAAQLLQRALGVLDDGKIGPATLQAVNMQSGLRLAIRVLAERSTLYGQIVSRDPVLRRAVEAGFRLQAENAGGWANRLAGLLKNLK